MYEFDIVLGSSAPPLATSVAESTNLRIPEYINGLPKMESGSDLTGHSDHLTTADKDIHPETSTLISSMSELDTLVAVTADAALSAADYDDLIQPVPTSASDIHQVTVGC